VTAKTLAPERAWSRGRGSKEEGTGEARGRASIPICDLQSAICTRTLEWPLVRQLGDL